MGISIGSKITHEKMKTQRIWIIFTKLKNIFISYDAKHSVNAIYLLKKHWVTKIPLELLFFEILKVMLIRKSEPQTSEK